MSKPGATLATAQDPKGRDTARTTMGTKGAGADVMFVRPNQAIPIVFVPGIMGSPLLARGERNRQIASKHMEDARWAWFPDSKGWLWDYAWLSHGDRKRLLDPEATSAIIRPEDADRELIEDFVTDNHSLPIDEALRRGWGSVMISSYGHILAFMERMLQFIYYNGHPYPQMERARPYDAKRWGELKNYKKITDEQLKKASSWRFPVYAVGYNWLQCNSLAAEYLGKRIDEILEDCRKRLKLKCDKVIVVTHSMGGLVGRACSQQKEGKILGVIHGVQPATGAGAAYRRVRAGWESGSSVEDFVGAKFLGPSAAEVMAVFANAAGPLELLPNQLYGPGWLKAVWHDKGQEKLMMSLPQKDPYDEIYRRSDTWWRLLHVNIAWAPPGRNDFQNPQAAQAAWRVVLNRLEEAKSFHYGLGNYYHPQSYVHYGADPEKRTWKDIKWKFEPTHDGYGNWTRIPAQAHVPNCELQTDVLNGQLTVLNKAMAGPALVNRNGVGVTIQSAGDFYRVKLLDGDDPGDGTVPGHSGKAPIEKAVFGARMTGYGHQDSYKDPNVEAVVLYSIIHLAQLQKDLE